MLKKPRRQRSQSGEKVENLMKVEKHKIIKMKVQRKRIQIPENQYAAVTDSAGSHGALCRHRGQHLREHAEASAEDLQVRSIRIRPVGRNRIGRTRNWPESIGRSQVRPKMQCRQQKSVDVARTHLTVQTRSIHRPRKLIHR